MSLTLSKNLTSHFEQLVIGPPLYERHGKLDTMAVYPLFPSQLSPDPPEILTLTEALQRGMELQDTGVISRVHVDNPLPTAVLAGESELLMGQTQQRSIQFSCLLPAQKKSSLPVNCVEEGQPTVPQAAFTGADACPWPVRTFKIEQLAQSGEPQQYWVWEQVKTYLTEAGSNTPTRDIRAALDKHSYQLQTLSDAFPHQAGQVGAICSVGPNLYMELFSDPELFEDRYDQILRSAMVEAFVRPSDDVVPPEAIGAFLNQIAHVSQHSRIMNSRSLKDTSRSMAFSRGGVSGQVLISQNRLIHLSAHQKCPGQSRPLADLRSSFDEAKRDWSQQRPSSMDDVEKTYARRRQRYSAFKSSLRNHPTPPSRPSAPDPGPSQEAVGNAAGPQPLSPALRDFFVALFTKDRA